MKEGRINIDCGHLLPEKALSHKVDSKVLKIIKDRKILQRYMGIANLSRLHFDLTNEELLFRFMAFL